MIRMWYNRSPSFSADWNERIQAIELVIKYANYYGSMPICRNILFNSLFGLKNMAQICESIAAEPARFVEIGAKLQNFMLVREAVVHYVGQNFHKTEQAVHALDVHDHVWHLIFIKLDFLRQKVEEINKSMLFKHASLEFLTQSLEQRRVLGYWREWVAAHVVACTAGDESYYVWYHDIAEGKFTGLDDEEIVRNSSPPVEPNQSKTKEENHNPAETAEDNQHDVLNTTKYGDETRKLLAELRVFAQDTVTTLLEHKCVVSRQTAPWLTCTTIDEAELPFTDEIPRF